MTPCPSTFTFESDASGRSLYRCQKPEGHGEKYGKFHKKRTHSFQLENGSAFYWTNVEEDDR